MRSYKLMLMLFSVSTIYNFTIAQQSLDLIDNRALLRNHSRNEIIEIEQKAPAEFALLQIYYTESFSVVILECDGCHVNSEEFYNFHLFNVTEFEDLRKENENFTFNFKEKYAVTLYSKAWLNNSLNGYDLDELIQFRPMREFPIWMGTGNDEDDYLSYSAERDRWIKDFTSVYRAKSNSGEFKVIRIDEWKSMPIVKRDQLLNGNVELLIID